MDILTTSISNNLQNQGSAGSYFLNESPVELQQKNPLLDRLADDGNKSFLDYVNWLGLSKDPNLIVLSSSHHYYYDAEDLKDVKTVLNLKQLNQIKEIKEFLDTINRMLSHKSYFAGSFVDRKNQFGFIPSASTSKPHLNGTADQIENGITSRIPFLNMMYNIMDSRTNRNLTKKNVTSLLEDAGMKVLDMSEINGLTCFCSQKIRTSFGYD
jgi:hypothetical protein